MDAEQVWKLWRRLLRDETLQQHLFQAQGATQWLQHFPEDERTILQAYAGQFDRVKWFVENYQFRLVNSFTNALETGAPLTLRALINIGLDLPTLSRTFLREQDWFDFGPMVYGYCDAVLGFLLERQELADYPEIRDLIGLERECVHLYTGLMDVAAPVPGHYQRTAQARLHHSCFALSHWLRDKSQLGRGPLEQTCEHILVYLPNLEARHKFTLISPRAASLYADLKQPRLLADLALQAPQNGDDLAVLGKLHKLNAIRIPA
ncbi:hypothetical protein SAMN03159304_05851 [Pseudomonas sp. NFACC24-1]|uniref:hypothetical protein n=1 Tax=Pseudomonas sp. NFACC24-1 TaxID=1566189 RepID=UPI0008DF416F|nr:hypothetical protein [Pseudomonas sp. NFACC24-1]SFP03802.1 hypothetical protein SAMN03159304_05851 [Pseudomonas sp. NFACC24-1]